MAKTESELLKSTAELLSELDVQVGNVEKLNFNQVFHRVLGATMTAKALHDRERHCKMREGVCRKNEETLERRLEVLRAQGHDLADLEDVEKKPQPAVAKLSLDSGELSEEESKRLAEVMSTGGMGGISPPDYPPIPGMSEDEAQELTGRLLGYM